MCWSRVTISLSNGKGIENGEDWAVVTVSVGGYSRYRVINQHAMFPLTIWVKLFCIPFYMGKDFGGSDRYYETTALPILENNQRTSFSWEAHGGHCSMDMAFYRKLYP